MFNSKPPSFLHGINMECGHDKAFRTKLVGYEHKFWCAACFSEWASVKFPAEDVGFKERSKNAKNCD